MYYIALPPSCGGDLLTPKLAYVKVDDPLEGLVRFAYCPAKAIHLPGVLHVVLRGLRVAVLVPAFGDVRVEVLGELREAAKLRSARRVTYASGRIYVEGSLERLDVERFKYGIALNFKVGKAYM